MSFRTVLSRVSLLMPPLLIRDDGADTGEPEVLGEDRDRCIRVASMEAGGLSHVVQGSVERAPKRVEGIVGVM